MEGEGQRVEWRDKFTQFFGSIYSHINSMDITTVTIWFCGLIVIFLVRDFASFGFTSFQNLCMCFFLVLMIFSMVIAMHQTMIYQKLNETGGTKR